eukprot:TRINITY_DN12076_c1_g2_i1.p3 TRINITY_DN12076_c1_g2~~TRINITY_DN12076_c1_g2_i1.p3  ORF type:complete len:213 (+),score=65.91 TRINITY_DN12076_c1_g2_i1:64-702(+)
MQAGSRERLSFDAGGPLANPFGSADGAQPESRIDDIGQGIRLTKRLLEQATRFALADSCEQRDKERWRLQQIGLALDESRSARKHAARQVVQQQPRECNRRERGDGQRERRWWDSEVSQWRRGRDGRRCGRPADENQWLAEMESGLRSFGEAEHAQQQRQQQQQQQQPRCALWNRYDRRCEGGDADARWGAGLCHPKYAAPGPGGPAAQRRH